MKDRFFARELGMRELYRIDLLKIAPPLPGKMREDLSQKTKKEAVLRFALDLIFGCLQNQKWIDQIIQQFLKNWELHRIPHIDRQILRIATYEFFFREDIPLEVTINEAIEMGKRYGSEKTGSFVNGVLDKIRKKKEQLKTTLPSGS